MARGAGTIRGSNGTHKRYERRVLPDDQRCTARTTRGGRCTLGRWNATSFCYQHHPDNSEQVAKIRHRGLQAQRKAMRGEDGHPPTELRAPSELLEHARRPPKGVGDLLLTLSWAAAALLAGQITKSDAEIVLDISKFQHRLLKEDTSEELSGEERAQLVALAGVDPEQAATMSTDQLMSAAMGAKERPLQPLS